MPITDQGVGWQQRDTSRHAAEAMGHKAGTLRQQVLAALSGGKSLTSEEIAYAIGREYGSVQPRVSELARDGQVIDTGKRREGRYGKMIIVWRLTPGQMELEI